nr:hypothetical protein [Tanacetum cinerariifolium]
MIHNDIFIGLDNSLKEWPDGVVDLTGDEDPTDEDGDTGMGDLTGVLVSLGGEIFSKEKNLENQTLVVVIILEIEERCFPVRLGNNPVKPRYSQES